MQRVVCEVRVLAVLPTKELAQQVTHLYNTHTTGSSVNLTANLDFVSVILLFFRFSHLKCFSFVQLGVIIPDYSLGLDAEIRKLVVLLSECNQT